MSRQEIKNELDNIDEYGFAIVHYFAYLNYYEIIEIIQEYGADINILSTESK